MDFYPLQMNKDSDFVAIFDTWLSLNATIYEIFPDNDVICRCESNSIFTVLVCSTGSDLVGKSNNIVMYFFRMLYTFPHTQKYASLIPFCNNLSNSS